MTEYELSATSTLYEPAGSGECQTLVPVRRGPGDQGFVMLAAQRPPTAGHTFAFKGSAYRRTRPRNGFQGWKAEVIVQ